MWPIQNGRLPINKHNSAACLKASGAEAKKGDRENEERAMG